LSTSDSAAASAAAFIAHIAHKICWKIIMFSYVRHSLFSEGRERAISSIVKAFNHEAGWLAVSSNALRRRLAAQYAARLRVRGEGAVLGKRVAKSFSHE
jgi:hypothetical protein